MFSESSALNSAPQSAATGSGRFDVGQFVSRQFNFLYILGAIAFLVVWPWGAHPLSAWERGRWLMMALLEQIVVVQVIKHLCYVPRPNSEGHFCWGRRPHSGFPSGHTVPAFLLATLVAAAHPVGWVCWYGGALLIAWARWRTQAHYAYQVVFSAMLGVICALVVLYLT